MNSSTAIMLCYARSGGTLLNRCLGSLENVIMVSEVNPLGGGAGIEKGSSHQTIKSQMKNWYDIEITSDGFDNEMAELTEYCKNNNKQLIVRDWPFINFSAHRLNDFVPPQKLLILDSISSETAMPFAFVRNGIDVWLSRKKVPLKSFAKEYLKFAQEIIANNIPVIKYEDFCSDPESVMKEICRITNMEYSESWKNFNDFHNCNGDNQRGKKSRHYTKQNIKLLERKKISLIKRIKLALDKDLKEANALLGYNEG